MAEVAAGLMEVAEYRMKWHGDGDGESGDSLEANRP